MTPEDKAKLEAGMVLVDGQWLSGDEAKRAQGLELFGGEWMLRHDALAYQSVADAEALAGVELPMVWNDYAFVAGPFDSPYLEEIAEGLVVGVIHFCELFQAERNLELLGGRRAGFFVFDRDARPYEETVAHFVSLTHTLGEAAVSAIQGADGFYWWDPYVLSSAKLGQRGPEHLRGHCVHHWGHLVLNRLGYDGRLLPPWYDEGFAAYLEDAVFERNFVFCSATEAVAGGGPGSRAGGGKAREFDTRSFRLGSWRQALEDALKEGGVRRFDRLCKLGLHELELLDVATSMVILQWMSQTGSEGALRRFHDVVRQGQPAAPLRIEEDVRKRLATYDEAFQAAVGMGWKKADEAWREWFLSH